MTREEIISGLQMTMDLIQFDPVTGNVRPVYTLNDLDKTTYLACKEAIEALKAQDVSETNVGSNGDTIYRQAAMSLAKDICVPTKDGSVYRHRCIDPDDILELPSAQPEIIMCKGCKYSHDEYGDGDCYCKRPGKGCDWLGQRWDFYCADAKPKEKP